MADETPKQEPERAAPQPLRPWYARLWAIVQRGGSMGWLVATIFQALLTWAFMGISELSEGWPWANQAKLLVVIAILATWGMALRTVRARLVELIRSWHMSVIAKAAQGGLGALPKKLLEKQEKYVNATVLRLRIIAAGITMPFFVMPAFTAMLCFAIAWHSGKNELVNLALICSAMAVIVPYYFRWSILAAPVEAPEAPARIAIDRHMPVRLRRNKWKQLED